MISNTLLKRLPLRIGPKDDPPNDKEEVRQQSTIQEVRPTSCSQSLDDVVGNARETLGIVQLSESLASISKQQINQSEEQSFKKINNAHIKTMQTDENEEEEEEEKKEEVEEEEEDLFKTAYEMGFLSKDEFSVVE